ncbi:helix-turn-helix domain-containing protein [Streptomyces sp. Tue6028]|uniref:helix-turn-helix domain-containing protein n=1 Tax=Streptomyces sp. Tue6028 TaxID=2036037 RepID=UPI003D7432EC
MIAERGLIPGRPDVFRASARQNTRLGVKGFKVIPRRWVVERTFGWLMHRHRHRNTARARMSRASSLLGVDLRRLQDRAVVDLALRVQDRPTKAWPQVDSLSLEGLLKSSAARDWATEFLAPLDTARHRDLRRTLTTWVTYDAHTETAAAKLDLHYKTVPAHLIAAEQLLQRPLLESHRQVSQGEDSANGCTGAHDVALAVHIIASHDTVLAPHLLA